MISVLLTRKRWAMADKLSPLTTVYGVLCAGHALAAGLTTGNGGGGGGSGGGTGAGGAIWSCGIIASGAGFAGPVVPHPWNNKSDPNTTAQCTTATTTINNGFFIPSLLIERPHYRGKLVASVLEIPELVETGASGRQQDRLSGFRLRPRRPHGPL
jgi:hypothetical protein